MVTEPEPVVMSTVTPPSSFGVTSMLPPSPGVTEAVVSPGVAVVVELEDAPPVTLPEPVTFALPSTLTRMLPAS